MALGGLFTQIAHNQGGALFQRQRRNQAMRRDISVFAEAIANGASLAAAGREIGVSAQRAYQLFTKMRIDLGDQAR